MVYPVFLDLRGLRCAVIGGGPASEAKVSALLDAGAHVVVIGPELTPRLEAWAAAGRIEVLRRPYRPGDLKGVWLAISASEDQSLTRAAWQEAEQRRIFFNAVDDPPHCRFIAGAVYRQGDLVVAVSTSGKAPALAVRLRDRIASTLGPEYAAFLALAGEVREEIARRVPDPEARRAVWYRVVDSDILHRLRRADATGARERLWELLREAEQR